MWGAFNPDFKSIRKNYSGRATIKHWRDYYKAYRGLFIIPLCIDILRNLRKVIQKWAAQRDLKQARRWRYRPVKIKEYAQWVDNLKTSKKEFVDFTTEPFVRQNGDPKVYAFYLTQFHSIPENDHAHGKGFTEWTNVAAATPQFIGHYQPKLPYDVGFYNLTQPGIIERQVEIAKAYGVYGFCFYYYWFSGKKLLEKPLEYFLHSGIDFHFHLCWATENWSKRWDGGENEIIVEQKLQSDDADKFFYDILPYISDPRYEQFEGKPILIIYRVDIFNKELLKSFIKRINTLAIEHGFKGIYTLCTNAFGFDKPNDYSCEGIVEFPPHALETRKYKITPRRLSPNSYFYVFDMTSYLKLHLLNDSSSNNVFKTCFPSWDNTPRKLYSNALCFNMTSEDFRNWLRYNILWTRQHHPDKNITYINAWNEWGEGAMLEPTTRYGYQILDILKQTVEETRK